MVERQNLSTSNLLLQMLELLKEQVYQGNMTSSTKQTTQLYEVPGHLVNKTGADENQTPDEHALIHQVAVLQRQLEVQQIMASDTLSSQLKQVRMYT